METQSFAPILILLALIVAFLYLHFTGGSGRARLYLAAVLVAVALIILLPSFNLDLPDWLLGLIGGTKIQLGLDLQGGTHLLMGVELDEAIKTQLGHRAEDIKRELKQNGLDYDDVSQDSSGDVVVKLKGSDERSKFLDLIAGSFPELEVSSANSTGGPAFTLGFKPRELTQIKADVMDKALETIRNRIDQLGVRETTVVREGDNEILVQLPGIQDPDRAKELIGKTAVLEFKLIDDAHNVQDAIQNGPPPGDEILYGSPERGGRTPYLVESPVLMKGDVVTDARVRPAADSKAPTYRWISTRTEPKFSTLSLVRTSAASSQSFWTTPFTLRRSSRNGFQAGTCR